MHTILGEREHKWVEEKHVHRRKRLSFPIPGPLRFLWNLRGPGIGGTAVPSDSRVFLRPIYVLVLPENRMRFSGGTGPEKKNSGGPDLRDFFAFPSDFFEIEGTAVPSDSFGI